MHGVNLRGELAIGLPRNSQVLSNQLSSVAPPRSKKIRLSVVHQFIKIGLYRVWSTTIETKAALSALDYSPRVSNTSL